MIDDRGACFTLIACFSRAVPLCCQATHCTFRSVVALKGGNAAESVSWGTQAARAFGRQPDDFLLELPMIDVAVHALEVMRRQGHAAAVADLHQMLLRQSRVRDAALGMRHHPQVGL